MPTGLGHDYLLVMRGAERTFAQIAMCFPGAPIHTLLHDPDGVGDAFAGHAIHPSGLQRLPVRQRGFRYLLPLYPAAVGRIDVSDYDVLVTSSSAFAIGLRPAPEATHVCYCHSPFRYASHERDRAFLEIPLPLRPLLAVELERIRRWEARASEGVDHLIANSKITRRRIAELWHRDSEVIHPPVDVERFQVGAPEDFVLIVGELVSHKRVADALAAAQRAGRPVKVVGTGPELDSLAARFTTGVEFLGRVDDDVLTQLMPRALAVIVSAVEEFGIVSVEAQAAGRPVIAPDRGGALETVIDGRTGLLYPADDFDKLAEILRDVDFTRFDPDAARESAARFHEAEFRRRITEYVAEVSGSGSRARRRGDAARPVCSIST